MSGWGSDPRRKPLAHKTQAAKWRKRNSVSIKVTKSTTKEGNQKS